MKVPGYKLFKARNKGYAYWKGKRHYFPGNHGSHESLAAYRKFLREKVMLDPVERIAAQRENLSITALGVRFLEWAKDYYRESPATYDTMARAYGRFEERYHQVAIQDFGPLLLLEFQEHLIDLGNSRRYINDEISRIKRVFKWGVSRQLVPAEIYQALATVDGIAKGRTIAREPPPRLPVPLWEIIPVLAEVSPLIRDMLLLQWYTGARPGEIRMARPDQFKQARDGSLLWTLDKHKTAHHGKVRVIPIGPRGQRILQPYLTLAESQDQEYLFDPRNAPRSRGTKNPYYTKDSYNQAIERAQAKVNKRRAQQKRPPLKWTPHQIRHAMGQRLEAEEGIEAVNAMLGHSTYSASSVYAHGKLKIAKDIAKRYG